MSLINLGKFEYDLKFTVCSLQNENAHCTAAFDVCENKNK